jgi:hypothetical protein
MNVSKANLCKEEPSFWYRIMFSFVHQEQASCYITALDNSRVLFEGSKEDFYSSGIIKTTDSSGEYDYEEERELWRKTKKTSLAEEREVVTFWNEFYSCSRTPVRIKMDKRPGKLVEDEKREVGHIGRVVWETCIQACGNVWY